MLRSPASGAGLGDGSPPTFTNSPSFLQENYKIIVKTFSRKMKNHFSFFTYRVIKILYQGRDKILIYFFTKMEK